MKRFTVRELRAALAHAAAGGQALHVHRIIARQEKTPRCFVAAIARGEDIAHLFDQDALRLTATARALGVNVVVIERIGTPRQHIDLCGGPLRKALALCEE